MGGLELYPRLFGVIALLAPALLVALVVVETFARPDGTLALRAPILVVIAIAAAVTAGARAIA